jgi:1-deoxy-D-xylulose-5-phosphate reductoisomerase
MRTPIAHGLAYPSRIDSGVAPLDFAQLADFSFTKPCEKRFPNLYLAIQASKRGQAATTALNAANEIAVEAFIQGQINFSQINVVNDKTLQRQLMPNLNCIDSILEHDKSSRALAHQIVKELN